MSSVRCTTVLCAIELYTTAVYYHMLCTMVLCAAVVTLQYTALQGISYRTVLTVPCTTHSTMYYYY